LLILLLYLYFPLFNAGRGITESIMALKSAIEILTDRGRFHSAAGHQKEIAQIYESELIDLDRAMQAYELAADWYAAEEATAYVCG